MAFPIPPITPYLIVSNAAKAIEFYTTAFGGTLDGEPHVMPGTNKIMHARVVINGGLIMLADDFHPEQAQPATTPEAIGGTPVMLALQLEDAQAFWDRAVRGGAIVDMPLAKMFWGSLYGHLVDPFGHKWSVTQELVQLSDEEMQQAAIEEFAEKGTLLGESNT